MKLAHYERWRLALEEGGRAADSTTKRIRSLERELARKEKAFAEAAALLVLKKKCRACTGRTRTTIRTGRTRSDPRWRANPSAEDERCGPHRRPGNALSLVEEAQIVSVPTSSRYSVISPKQLVPQLADEGLYLASESTMYRVQRRYGLRPKK